MLIITYYWPPYGGSAVLRWLKFTKYLREFNWEPVIYTPLNPEPQVIDTSLLNDIPENLTVIKSKIWEPYTIYKWLTGRKKSEKLGVALMSENKTRSVISWISLWIRSNFFIPDPRISWVGPSVRLLKNYLHNNLVDVIITTGPPHSMHLIGLKLKELTNAKWLADFRDPWTNIDFYKELLLTKWSDRKHKQLEKNVLTHADHIITVSPSMTTEFQTMGIHNISTITNGFDTLPHRNSSRMERGFTMMHLGSMPASRNPVNLWKVLSELIKENHLFADKLEVILSDKTDIKIVETIRHFDLDKHIKLHPYTPHEEAMQKIRDAHVLLLFVNNSPNARGILTNKLFEYLSAKRPILAIGPEDGDVAMILSETHAGRIFDFKEHKALKQHLLSLFDLYSHNRLQISSKGIEKYHRKDLTGDLVRLLNRMIS
ncbi:MAG: glycosyltransferase [Bacteroidales bacterium]|nr:glycosyltransferase [Bacteroidales bacterium]